MSRGFGKGGNSRGDKSAHRHSSKYARDNRANQLNPIHPAYWASRGRGSPTQSNQSTPNTSNGSGSWSKRMSGKDAARIQSHADRTNTNQKFKERSQSAAAKTQHKNAQR